MRIFIFAVVFLFPPYTVAEEVRGIFIGYDELIKIYLLAEGNDDDPDAVGCETTIGRTNFETGVIYRFKYDSLYYDPEFDHEDDFNLILFSEQCEFQR